MRKNCFFIFGIFCCMFLLCIFLNSCVSFAINRYYPDPYSAVDPPGLAIDSENYAYLGGRIRAINEYDFNPGMGAVQSYPVRSLRVPAGEPQIALVYYYYAISNRINSSQVQVTTHYGFKIVSLPPLENGVSYVLYLAAPGNNIWEDSHILFKRIDPVSWKIEDIRGAAFADESILDLWR